MPETYAEIEERVQQIIQRLEQLSDETERPNIAATARDFQVSEHRLRKRWNGSGSKMDRLPPNRKPTAEQELALCQYLDQLDAIGIPARIPMITSAANSILRRCHIDQAIPPPTVSHMWTKRFLDRHPEYYVRKQKTLDQDRKKAHHPDDLSDWFRRYKAKRDEKGIQDADCYNFDETGFRIGIGKDQWVVTREPTRPLYLPSSSNRELVTVCETVSSDGEVLPPMIIIPGQNIMEDWFETGLAGNVLVGVSDTGYSNDELSLDWVHHFERFSLQKAQNALERVKKAATKKALKVWKQVIADVKKKRKEMKAMQKERSDRKSIGRRCWVRKFVLLLSRDLIVYDNLETYSELFLTLSCSARGTRAVSFRKRKLTGTPGTINTRYS